MGELNVHAIKALGANQTLVANLGIEQSGQIETTEVPNGVKQIVNCTSNHVIWSHSWKNEESIRLDIFNLVTINEDVEKTLNHSSFANRTKYLPSTKSSVYSSITTSWID